MPPYDWSTGKPMKPLSPTPPIFDKLGKQIEVGAFIVYGSLLGRSAALKIGKVLKIAAYPKDSGYSNIAIGVQGVERNYSWDPKPGDVKLGGKGTLQFPDRCLVVNPADLPKNIQDLFAL